MFDHDEVIYSIHASFCGALANEKRLRIFHLLGDGDRPVKEIAQTVGITPSNASQHLRIMRNLGIVRAHKEGTQSYYRLTSKKFSEGYRLIREGLAELHFAKADVLFPEDEKKKKKH
jgi:ArsR family transcriptional regulator